MFLKTTFFAEESSGQGLVGSCCCVNRSSKVPSSDIIYRRCLKEETQLNRVLLWCLDITTEWTTSGYIFYAQDWQSHRGFIFTNSLSKCSLNWFHSVFLKLNILLIDVTRYRYLLSSQNRVSNFFKWMLHLQYPLWQLKCDYSYTLSKFIGSSSSNAFQLSKYCCLLI